MLPLLSLHLEFTTGRPLELPPHPGSKWRSAFGTSLRGRSCITGAPTCEACPVKAQCAYGYLFETPPPTHTHCFPTPYEQLSRPYVFSPGDTGWRKVASSQLSLDFTLFAPAQRFLAPILSTLHHLRIDGCPLRVEHASLTQPAAPSGHAVTDPAAIIATAPAAPTPPPCPDAVTLTLRTPLRLRCNNQYLNAENFSFRPFFTTLTRRISMLAALSDTALPERDFAALAAAAEAVRVEHGPLQWQAWNRYSARQNRNIPMGGLTGTLTLAGDLTPLWPWLWVGQWTHVGKGTVMGNGGYSLVP